MYKPWRVIGAWLLASFCTAPVTFFSVVAFVLAQAAFSSSGLRIGSIADILANAALFNLYTLPTSFIASLLTALPFVVRANHRSQPIHIRTGVIVGACSGALFALAWSMLLHYGSPLFVV